MRRRDRPGRRVTVSFGDDRAINDVISFVLVFGLIASTVALVMVVGFDNLEASRDSEQTDNAERAFDVLADNIEDLYQENAPSRATEIKLSEASLTLAPTTDSGDPATSSLFYQASDGVNSESDRIYTRTITYSDGSGGEVVYEAGAVFREGDDGAVMLNEPPMVFTERQTTITAVDVIGEPGARTGGSVTVLVRTVNEGTDVVYPSSSAGPTVSGDAQFTVETSTARAHAWEAYLEDEIDWESDACQVSSGGTGDRVNCQFSVDELYVTDAVIRVEFS